VNFSDSGMKRHAFAIVELDDEQSIVVPVEKLKLATPVSSESRGWSSGHRVLKGPPTHLRQGS